MGNAYWPFDGRQLTTVSLTPKIPWDARITEKHWRYSEGPPDDDPSWLFVGETDDHERLWCKYEVPVKEVKGNGQV